MICSGNSRRVTTTSHSVSYLENADFFQWLVSRNSFRVPSKYFLMKIHPYVLPGDGWLLPTTCLYIDPFVFSLNTSLMKIHPYALPGDGCFLPFVDVNTFVRWKFIPVDGWLISIPFDRCPLSQYFLMKIHSCGDCWLRPIWCVLSQWYLMKIHCVRWMRTERGCMFTLPQPHRAQPFMHVHGVDEICIKMQLSTWHLGYTWRFDLIKFHVPFWNLHFYIQQWDWNWKVFADLIFGDRRCCFQ